MIKIACIGIAVQDRLYYVEQLPEGGGKYVAKGYREIGGGPAATAAVAAARLGARVDFIGRVGDDDVGTALLAELEHDGVNTALTRVCSGARSSQSAILVDRQGERMIINAPCPDLPADAGWLEAIDFGQYDAVLADVRWHEGSERAFILARRAGVTTVLDADLTPQDIRPLITLADHAAFSEPGLQRVTGEADFSQALAQVANLTNGTVYVTRGSAGCYWLEGATLRHRAGFTVNVVDTTGAGDVFHGALAFAIADSMPLEQAVRFANGVAALKCTRPGGREGIPSHDQIDAFLSSSV